MLQAKGLFWEQRDMLGDYEHSPCYLKKRHMGSQGSQGSGWFSLAANEKADKPTLSKLCCSGLC